MSGLLRKANSYIVAGAILLIAPVAVRASGVVHLMIGVDQESWPDQPRTVVALPCDCGTNEFDPPFLAGFADGDRLAGNSPLGNQVFYLGTGIPMFAPNEFGSLSFFYRRGGIPQSGGRITPWQGVDFLGGPLLDLDGDDGDGLRSLIPVANETAVTIPESSSLIELGFDRQAGTIELISFDATGTNEGGFGIGPGIATTINVMAGTEPDGSQTGPINPTIDTRMGTLTAFAGSSGLTTVFRIDDLGYEFWQDTLLAESSSAAWLGTFQFLGRARGWLIERDPVTGMFPVLSGEGIGDTLWPRVDTTGLGTSIAAREDFPPAPSSTTIVQGLPAGGSPDDDFLWPGNAGGSAPTDLGDYFDNVVIPELDPLSHAFVYLEAAGFGANNSGDPLYLDSISYDVVIIAQEAPIANGDQFGDGDVDLLDYAGMQRCFTDAGLAVIAPACQEFDIDRDSDVDADDLEDFVPNMTGPV